MVAVLFYLAVGSLFLVRSRSARYPVLILLPLVLLAGAGSLCYSSVGARTDRRVDSFQLGARIRLAWAGGASRIRGDALSLLAAASEDGALARSEWPASLDALGAVAVEVYEEERLVDVAINARSGFGAGDRFGYLIGDEGREEPVLVDAPGGHGHRLWRIAGGIYSYERW